MSSFNGCVGSWAFCLRADACNFRCCGSGSIFVSSCRCCVLVPRVHPVAIRRAMFCVVCSLLMLVSDAIGDHTVDAYSSVGQVIVL